MSKLISQYLKYAFWSDLLLAILFMIVFSKMDFYPWMNVPSSADIDDISLTLISVSGTLLGFLLTIITVLVTFKKAYRSEEVILPDKVDYTVPPKTTIFDKLVEKEDLFYGSNLYKGVILIFSHAAYELALIILIQLFVQLNVIALTLKLDIALMIGCLYIVFITLIRSLITFHFFLKVHAD
jgi:hypothetical protein